MEFVRNEYDEVVVYTDGSCPRNGTCMAQAGVGVWFDDDHPLNWSSGIPGVQTNNNAEIYGSIKAIEILLDYYEYDVEIMTDSEFLQNCVHLWMYGKWKWNGWKNNKGRTLANKIMLMKLDKLIGRMRSVTVTYVRGHSNVYGNEQADMLARNGAFYTELL